MKTARMGVMVFAFCTLVGGYFIHQYFWLMSGPGAEKWNASVLPLTIGLGWILLIAAIAFAFAKGGDSDE